MSVTWRLGRCIVTEEFSKDRELTEQRSRSKSLWRRGSGCGCGQTKRSWSDTRNKESDDFVDVVLVVDLHPWNTVAAGSIQQMQVEFSQIFDCDLSPASKAAQDKVE